ncbi:MAG TPA: zf-HC2 domain-containing protein [Rudaea sp.]|nr:zf-HC2 domain-containing protein [Rudaea sp.]
MKPLHISCRQASVLLSQREDEPLGWFDRWRLRAHLSICSYCRNVSRQFASLRLAMRRWRDREE